MRFPLYYGGTPISRGDNAKAQIIEDMGLSAPNVYEYVDSKKGIVYEYVQGISMLHLVQKNPLKLVRYAKHLAILHVEIHRRPATVLTSIKDAIAAMIRSAQSLEQFR